MINTKMTNFFGVLSLLFAISIPISLQKVNAAPSKFKQSIVPLECYIDAVNSGNGSHLYITPEDCRKEEATDTIQESLAPTSLMNDGFGDYGQDNTDRLITGPQSQEFEPEKQNVGSFGLYDSLKSDPVTSLLIISMVLLPISIGLYLRQRPGNTKVK